MQWQPRQKSDWAESIGGALNALADYKLQSMLQEKQQKKLLHQNALGISKATGTPYEEALGIAGLAPVAQGAYIKAKGAGGSPEREKAEIAAAYGEPYDTALDKGRSTITSAIDNIGYTSRNAPQKEKELIPAGLFNQNQQQRTKQEQAEQIFPQDQQIANTLKQLANPLNQENKQPNFAEQKKAVKEIAKEVEQAEPSQYIAPAPLPTARPPINPAGLTSEQYRKRLEERHQLEQEDAKEGEAFWKERLDSKEALPQEEHALRSMLKRREKGNLPPAKEWKFLTDLEENPVKLTAAGTATGAAIGAAALLGLGPVAPAIGAGIGGSIGTVVGYLGHLYAGIRKSELREGNPDIAEYEKEAASLVKQIPKTFKGTISEAVLTSFMDTIPTLSVDNEGSKRILKNLIKGTELTKKLNATADSIYEQNGHKIPRGFQHLVLKKHEKAVEDWMKELEETVEYGQTLPAPNQ